MGSAEPPAKREATLLGGVQRRGRPCARPMAHPAPTSEDLGRHLAVFNGR
jgi:hypothetical protein